MSSRAATRVFQGVEEQIATGQLKDGAKLDEASLAERFEVPALRARSIIAISGLWARHTDSKTWVFRQSTIPSRHGRNVRGDE